MAPLLHVDRSLIDVIPRGRDGAALGRRNESRRAAVRERLGLPADAPVVGLAARHEWQKGVDRFVDALPALVGTLPVISTDAVELAMRATRLRISFIASDRATTLPT